MPNEERNPKLFLFGISFVLISVWMYPWIFGVSCLSFIAGFYLLERVFKKLEEYFLKSKGGNGEAAPAEVYQLDPLLHPTPYVILDKEASDKRAESSHRKHPETCSVCDAENCPRRAATEKGVHSCRSSNSYGVSCHDLRIDPALDKALGKFCSTVFGFYVNANWAPYETRKQLKLAFKKLLTNFGGTLEKKLAQDELAVEFCKEKIIPLLIHYIDKVRSKSSIKLNEKTRSNNRKVLERIANLKTKRLCRQLIEQHLPADDQKCALWMELCSAVLGDGVIWNLILLGRNKLPQVLSSLATDYKQTVADASWSLRKDFLSFLNLQYSACIRGAQQYLNKTSSSVLSNSASPPVSIDNQNQNNPSLLKDLTVACLDSTAAQKVPLLIDCFLDPVNDLYQSDAIVSRWRPSLDEILIERELLYCLIQYLKKHRALEYLQAVLDESPDGSEYCRKVLKLEYLPSFCRSKFFMESLGVSQVDSALEAGNDSPGSRRKSGHARSSSYGGGNSGIQIWKIGDPKAIDGLALYNDPLGAQGQGYSHTDPSLHRRQYSIEVVITKFMRSAYFTHAVDDGSASKQLPPPPARRAGIDSKSYAEVANDDVLSELVIGPCDIFDCASEIGVSCISKHVWIQPVLSGWLKQLQPFVKPYFDHFLHSQLRQYLSVNTCVYLIDLITDAFLANNVQPSSSSEEPSKVLDSSQLEDDDDPDSTAKLQNLENEKLAKIRESLINLSHWFLNQFVDPGSFAQAIQENDDEIILFFVDLLDALVNHVSGKPTVNSNGGE